MAFSPVSWAYRDVFTSAKGAQMEENTRTHDHDGVDQGARIGGIEIASGVTTVAVGGLAANTRGDYRIDFPAGRFAAQPRAVVTLVGGGANGRLATVLTTATDVNGFTVYVWSGSTAVGAGGVQVQWIAATARD